MPSALVTGATGFVGSNLVAELRSRDWEVGCLVRDVQRAASLEPFGARLHLGSLGDAESLERAMSGVDTVFHVAGRVRALNDRQLTADNVVGTRNVVDAAAAQTEPPVVLLVSSLAAGGPSQPGTPRRESDDDQPLSAYGRSKLAVEHEALHWADQVPISIVRPPIVFGSADKLGFAIFRGIHILHLHPVPGFRHFPVSLVHVVDLCNAMIRIAERGTRVVSSNLAGATYHVAAQRAIAYGDLGKLAAQSLGCAGVALPLPKAFFWLVGGVMEVLGQIRRRPGVLNLDKIREAVASGWECDDEKIRQELDYQPAASLEDRFAETAQWYREQGWL